MFWPLSTFAYLLNDMQLCNTVKVQTNLFNQFSKQIEYTSWQY